MRKTPAATYLWPGLPQLWVDGSGTGLVLATGFALVVNVLIAVTWIWIEVLGAWPLRALWLAALALWCGSLVVSCWARRTVAYQTQAAGAEDLFRSAQNEYLRGNWSEAQSHLDNLLCEAPQDVEARLLLATLLRRTKRYKEAREALVRLERLELSAHWQSEIEAEWRALDGKEAGVAAQDAAAAVPEAAQAA